MSIALQDLSQSTHNPDASQNRDSPPHLVSEPSSSHISTSDAGADESQPAENVITTSLANSTSSATSAPVIDDASSEVQESAAAQPNGSPSPRKRWYGFGSSMTKIIVFLVTVAAFGVTIYYSEYAKREQDEGNILSRQGNEKAAESLEQGDISLALDLWGYCVDKHIEEIQECQNQDHRVMEYLIDEAQVSRRSTYVIVSSGRQLWNTLGDFSQYVLNTYRKAFRKTLRMVSHYSHQFISTVPDYAQYMSIDCMGLYAGFLHAVEIFVRWLREITANSADSLLELYRSSYQTSLQMIALSEDRLWQFAHALAHHLLGAPKQFGQNLSRFCLLFHPASDHWFTKTVVMTWTLSTAFKQTIKRYPFSGISTRLSSASETEIAAYPIIPNMHLLAMFTSNIVASRSSGGWVYPFAIVTCVSCLLASTEIIFTFTRMRVHEGFRLGIENAMYNFTIIVISADEIISTGTLSWDIGLDIITDASYLFALQFFSSKRIEALKLYILVFAATHMIIHITRAIFKES